MKMLNLSFKKLIIVILFLASSGLLYAQKNLDGFSGNITITDTSLEKIVNSFYHYLVDKGSGKKFNSTDYFVGVTVLHSDDSTNNIEITLSNYALSRPSVKKLPGFYGFLKKEDIYFLFWDKNKFIKKINKTSNPNVFKKFKKPRIAAPYDPYMWVIILRNDKVMDMSPKETIQKYIN